MAKGLRKLMSPRKFGTIGPIALSALIVLTSSGYVLRASAQSYGYNWQNCTYTGFSNNRSPNGQGTCTWPSGARLVAKWTNGMPVDGDATLTWPNPNDQGGEASSKSAFHFGGTGKLKWTTNGFMLGNWSDKEATGQGIYVFYNGQSYIGGFKEAKRSGYGTNYSFDGHILQRGYWIEDQLTTPDSASSGSRVAENSDQKSKSDAKAFSKKCIALGYRLGSVKFDQCVNILSN
jgi:hypothetical protein